MCSKFWEKGGGALVWEERGVVFNANRGLHGGVLGEWIGSGSGGELGGERCSLPYPTTLRPSFLYLTLRASDDGRAPSRQRLEY